MSTHSGADLRRIYEARFANNLAYRRRVWRLLVSDFFQKYVSDGDTILDLGCGYGEFINAVSCSNKLAMDLNPDARKYLDSSVQFLEQDCSTRWQVGDNSLNIVFTSNFFEHLPNKSVLGKTLDETFRCLVPGGQLIALGPNLKHLTGEYWDFWDHYLPLTEISLAEGLTSRGFGIDKCVGKFLPYTMVKEREYPELFLKLYLKLPVAWRVFGKQFLIVARKPAAIP